ncbi:MerR family transcriptional regulator [Streptomyces longispororuber]|uniref:MerR family transcriptional regulator n=1 Tax=Streptomyces longispororuber TaxID=68230 RepID=A0A919A0K6_9ACTN|nr:MerR family transcriptional regulator [Streptomyces longispororuber]GHE77777.1 MerR family transcriptional regulator [Streptomyces longispororuber]
MRNHPEDDTRRTAGLLSIGAFARRTRLSAKALRLYDRQGLLPPAYVDGATGYRYYLPAQVERARTVVLLRRLGMPLADIAAVLRLDGERAAAALDGYWADVEERHAARRTLVGYLRGRLSGRSTAMSGTFEVRTVEVPETAVIGETRHLVSDELPAWIGDSLGRLEEAAEDCGGITGPPFVIYHSDVTEESDGPAEACVPVADLDAARAWVAARGRARGLTARMEPAYRMAYVRITKAQVVYPQILAAFDAVEEWITQEGLTPAGPCREVYFAEWDGAGPEDEVCDVAFPVR